MRKRLAMAILVATTLAVPAGMTAQRSGRPPWPKQSGAFIAISSETIPVFPRVLSGYRPMRNGFTYWNEPFELTGSIRVGDQWDGIYQFPVTMNHCSDGVWMIRWRAANPDVRIASRLASEDINEPYQIPGNTVKVGRFGYMYGFNCVQPAFKFSRAVNGNTSNIDDIYYELKFWRAAP